MLENHLAPKVILLVIFMLTHYWNTYITATKHMYNHLKLADVQNLLHRYALAKSACKILPLCLTFLVLEGLL